MTYRLVWKYAVLDTGLDCYGAGLGSRASSLFSALLLQNHLEILPRAALTLNAENSPLRFQAGFLQWYPQRRRCFLLRRAEDVQTFSAFIFQAERTCLRHVSLGELID